MNRKFDSGTSAVVLLATTIVVVMGLVLCLGMVFTFSNHYERDLWLCVGGFVGITLILWLLRDRRENGRVATAWLPFFALRGPRTRVVRYQPKRVRFRAPSTESGPATVDRIREIRESSNLWVPARGQPPVLDHPPQSGPDEPDLHPTPTDPR